MTITSLITKKTILIVEDSISMRHTIKASLRAQGFENLIEANDGQIALTTMNKGKVDLVISDWSMPNMSGMELYNYLKDDEKLKNIPFILLTGNDQKDHVTEALKSGIKHYMVKPFNPKKLFEKMNELLEQQE
jgi:two-component system, chemotaxis family, chemotaxis protein CheY